MTYRPGRGLSLALAVALLCGAATAAALAQEPQQREEHHPAAASRPAAPHRAAPHAAAPHRAAPHRAAPNAAAPHAAAPRGEPHRGPQSGHGVTPPGENARPRTFNRSAYQRNFQAPRSFRSAPYRRPAGWVARRWTYGQILPRAFWVPQYVIANYWRFGLQVPPIGYDWVRYGADALLVNMTTGQILQVEYGVFA